MSVDEKKQAQEFQLKLKRDHRDKMAVELKNQQNICNGLHQEHMKVHTQLLAVNKDIHDLQLQLDSANSSIADMTIDFQVSERKYIQESRILNPLT